MDDERRGESGFSLMEVIVATIIATIAVVGLAYTFGMGRGFIDRFAVGRAALAAAQGQLDRIAAAAPGDTLTTLGTHASAFMVGGVVRGTTTWSVSWIDDPADGVGAADPNPNDIKQASVSVQYREGSMTDSVQLSRLLPSP